MAIRLVLLTLPWNAWGQVVPPQPWSLLRNLPLLALTFGVGALYLHQDVPSERWQRIVGVLLMASALFPRPVALWIQHASLLGLLMIPKSIAYLAVALIVHRRLPCMAPNTSG